MENYTNYTNILSVEEKTLLENLINKLAVSGIRQYNTQAATILFNSFGLFNDENEIISVTKNLKQEIKDDLNSIDNYIMGMQDMLRSKPIITNLEKIRDDIYKINIKLYKL